MDRRGSIGVSSEYLREEVFGVLLVIDNGIGGRSEYGSRPGHESGQGKGKSRNTDVIVS